MSTVSIGRDSTEISLPDTKGAKVKLYTALTVAEQTEIFKKYNEKSSMEQNTMIGLETVAACFIEWNIAENGTILPCTPEVLKRFTQRDVLAMLQACSGRRLLDDDGNILTPEMIEKKTVNS